MLKVANKDNETSCKSCFLNFGFDLKKIGSIKIKARKNLIKTKVKGGITFKLNLIRGVLAPQIIDSIKTAKNAL